MTKRLLGFVVLALGAWALWSASFTVTESETVFVARFGDPRRQVDEAGLHFKWPAPIDTLWRVDSKIRLLDVEEEEFLTADKKNLLVRASIAWSVTDPLTFLRSASGVEQVELRLMDLLHTQIGNVLGAHAFDQVIATDTSAPPFDSIDAAIGGQAAQAAADTYGVTIHVARITRLTFPASNKRAVFNRMEAEREKIAREIRSEGFEVAEGIRTAADTEASKLTSSAKLKAAEIVGAARADAERIYTESYARDPKLFELLRTLEALENAFDSDDTFVIPSNSQLVRLLVDIESTGLLDEVWSEGGPLHEPKENESVGDSEAVQSGDPE